MSLMVALLFVVGLVLLVVGAEVLVKGASRLALAFRISPLVVGLTVVAFGTSAPEMAVSAGAALSGQGDIALGNVLGSNIFNVLFILGLSALIAPLVVSRQLIRFDVPLMIAASVLVVLLSLDGQLGRFDGVLLIALIIGYTGYLVVSSRRENSVTTSDEQTPDAAAPASLPVNLLFVAGGLIMLVLGARWLVDGAVAMATSLGLSERVIALTIVAAGTSLPEVATSVIASIRGQRDIAVGNVVGSNLFNLLAVLGLAGVLSPAGVVVAEAVLRFDMLVMLVVAFACLPIFFTGMRINRWEGLLFLAYYVVYTAHLIMSATGNAAAADLQTVVLMYVGPLTVLTLLTTSLQEVKRRRLRL